MSLGNPSVSRPSASDIKDFLSFSAQNTPPLKVSLVHASGSDVHPEGEFSLRPYEVVSTTRPVIKSQTPRPSAKRRRGGNRKGPHPDRTDSDVNADETPQLSHEFFVNCDAQVLDIDLVHDLADSRLSNAVLMLVATNSTSHYLVEGEEYHTFVHTYALTVAQDSTPALKLLALTPIKRDTCVKLKSVKINFETGFLFVVLLFKSGTVRLCRFNLNSLAEALGADAAATNSAHNFTLLPAECLWEHSPAFPPEQKRLTCFDLSYNEGLVTLACGTNDGFVELWDFKLDLFKSPPAEANDERDFVASHRDLPLLTGVNNNLLSREITDLAFLPLPDAFVVAVGTFAKGIILWYLPLTVRDTTAGFAEGELKTYHVPKPVNRVAWTPNLEYLLGCASTGLLIDWASRQTVTTVSADRLTGRKAAHLVDNVCWGADADGDSLFFVFDTGE